MDKNNSALPPPRKNHPKGIYIKRGQDPQWIPNPEGPGRLREILDSMAGLEDIPNLESNPIYMIGVTDGRIAATEEAKCVVRGLMRMWDDEDE